MSRVPGPQETKRWQIVAVSVLALVVLVLVFLAVTRDVEPPSRGTDPVAADVDTTPSGDDTASAETLAPSISTTVAQAMKRLQDEPSRPWRMSVIGDSTGVNADNGWVKLLVDWAAKEYDRPVQVHWWSVEKDKHIEWVVNRGGKNAPIILWNASAGGKDFSYSQTRLDDLIPPAERKRIDLLFINHGHNLEAGSDYFYAGRPFVTGLMTSLPSTAIFLIAQNPERVGTDHEKVGTDAVDQVKSFAAWSRLPFVDMFDLFMKKSGGNADTLLDDTDYHPNARGYIIWFRAVRDALLSS